MLFSFIIPALNEERNIANAIVSIYQTMENREFEVIVVDNGSSDKTPDLAAHNGAKVIVAPGATIGKLRNIGVWNSSGDILIFIDADVRLARNWGRVVKQESRKWRENPLIVTGSTCLPSEEPSFVEKHWFARLPKSNSGYINSGHLITTKELFLRTGGFNETLKTSEDVDFCKRCVAHNAKVEKDPGLEAYHEGYPSTISEFVAREAWHGISDFKSLESIVHSKTALSALFNSCLLLSGTLGLLITQEPRYFAFLVGSFLFCALLSVAKFRLTQPAHLIRTAICCEFYLIGRSISPFFRKRRPSARA